MAPFDVDEANPADDGLVSQFPANERASRASIEGLIGAEHDTVEGRHMIPVGDNALRESITTWKKGSLFIKPGAAGKPGTLEFQSAESAPFQWADLGRDEFQSGTRMVFHQAAAPLGWTQDETVNDRVLRVVGSAGGGNGGSWTISGLTNGVTGSHALTVNEMPAHDHGVALRTVSVEGAIDNTKVSGSATGGADQGVTATPVSSTGGGAGHTHPGSTISSSGAWRPLHTDVIVCEKD